MRNAATSAAFGVGKPPVELAKLDTNYPTPTPKGQDVFDVDDPIDIIFMSCPIRVFNTLRYCDAVKLIRKRHPRAKILRTHCLWEDNKDWLKTYHHVLEPVTIVYILPDDDGTVGRGTVDEVQYLLGERDPAVYPVYGLAGPSDALRIHPCVYLSSYENGRDWRRYAELKCLRTVPESKRKHLDILGWSPAVHPRRAKRAPSLCPAFCTPAQTKGGKRG